MMRISLESQLKFQLQELCQPLQIASTRSKAHRVNTQHLSPSKVLFTHPIVRRRSLPHVNVQVTQLAASSSSRAGRGRGYNLHVDIDTLPRRCLRSPRPAYWQILHERNGVRPHSRELRVGSVAYLHSDLHRGDRASTLLHTLSIRTATFGGASVRADRIAYYPYSDNRKSPPILRRTASNLSNLSSCPFSKVASSILCFRPSPPHKTSTPPGRLVSRLHPIIS